MAFAPHVDREVPKQTVPQVPVQDYFPVLQPVQSFAGVINAINSTYYLYYDQALQDSQANSLAMRRDGFIDEILRHRQMPVVCLPHHVEVDDPDHPEQKSIGEAVHKIVCGIPRLKMMMLNLLEAIFYGKYGSQVIYGTKKIAGNEWNLPIGHFPVNGDKFRYKFDGTPGVALRSGVQFDESKPEFAYLNAFKDSIQSSMLGQALYLDNEFLRDRFIIHSFETFDTDYLFELEEAMSVFGLGKRSRLYWTWNLKMELLSWMTDALQRVGANGMIFGMYPEGNNQAQAVMLQAVRMLCKDNVAVFPVKTGENSYKDIIQRIEPSAVGYDVMMNLINYLDGIMRRDMLGQDLSSESKPTGIGGGAAKLQGNVRSDYIEFDAGMLDETLDQDLLDPILKYNRFIYEGRIYYGCDLPFSCRFRHQVTRDNVEGAIQAANTLFQMGVPLDSDDLRTKAGLSPPKKKATALINHAVEAQAQQNKAGVPDMNKTAEHMKGVVDAAKQNGMGGNGKPIGEQSGNGKLQLPAPSRHAADDVTRLARAGDCGHDEDGKFSDVNTCASVSGRSRELEDYEEGLPLYSDDDLRADIKAFGESGDANKLAIAKDELRSRMREKRGRLERLTEENYADNIEKSKGADSIMLSNGEDSGLNRIMVHKSARDPGKWQLTFFSYDGHPAGHDIFDTKEDAIGSASGMFINKSIPHGHRGFKVKEVVRRGEGGVKTERFRRLANAAERASPISSPPGTRRAEGPVVSRHARAGDPSDCGHESRGGHFSQGNTCSAEAGKSIDKSFRDHVHRENLPKGSFGHDWLKGLAKDAKRGDFSSIRSALEQLDDPDMRQELLKHDVYPGPTKDYLRGLVATAKGEREHREEPRRLSTAEFGKAAFDAALKVPQSGKFHDNKVFINHAYKAFQDDRSNPRMSLDEFKDELIKANQSDDIHLGRADMVSAMNPDDVRESNVEIWYGPKKEFDSPAASFNFIVLPEKSRHSRSVDMSRLVRAGDPSDCGHERQGGLFEEGNTCAGDSESGREKAKPTRGLMVTARRVGVKKEARIVMEDGREAPPHIKPSMVPPGWTDVRVSVDPDAEVLVTGRDAKGRPKMVTSESYDARSAVMKFNRVLEMINKHDAISREIQAARHDSRTREEADCSWLMQIQATRPGSNADTKAKVKAYGATTLEARHVVQSKEGIRLVFVGKEGINHDHLIRDPELAFMLLKRKKAAGSPDGTLFQTSDARVRDFVAGLDGGKFSPKDFRTSAASRMARDMVAADPRRSRDIKEHVKRVKAVAERVSSLLGNKPAQALKSYIYPAVFEEWKP